MELPDTAPRLSELTSDVALPVAGGDTLAASMAILAKMKGMTP